MTKKKRFFINREVRDIVNILTAIGNSNLNNILRKETNFKILENDIFYKEGVLEYLEKNKNIDIIILYEKLNGQLNIIDLIKKIKKLNNEIIIFFILENKNIELENLLKLENIKNIFLNSEINIEEFIYKLKNIKINNFEKLNEEIILLKKIINKKDEEINNLKNNQLIEKNNINNNIFNKLNKNNKYKNFNNLDENSVISNLKNKKEIIEDEKNIYIIFYKIKKYIINKNISENIIKKLKRENQK